MERDALLAYGASNLMNERLFYSSDAYEVSPEKSASIFFIRNS